MKTNYFQVEFKEIEVKQDLIKIKGFASTPDIDRYNDIVNPKAFNTAMSTYMNNPIILLQHNSDKPIGKTIAYNLSNKGLEVTVELSNNIENTFELVTNKILKGFSIGFIPKKWDYKVIGQTEIREITELDLIEISVVSTPANPTSLFTLSKSIKAFFDEMANLEINNNTMDKELKEIIEEKVEEVIEEVVEETKMSDEVETAGENPEVVATEEVTETTDEVVEVVAETEVTNDEAENQEIKSLKDMMETQKTEIEELKASLLSQKSIVDTLLDSVLELSSKTSEVKSMVDNIPIKKGLATLGTEQKSVDPLYSELMKAKNKF